MDRQARKLQIQREQQGYYDGSTTALPHPSNSMDMTHLNSNSNISGGGASGGTVMAGGGGLNSGGGNRVSDMLVLSDDDEKEVRRILIDV